MNAVLVAGLLTYRVPGALRVGLAVELEMDGQGRVVRLVPAQG